VTNDDLLKALRDTARSEHSDFQASQHDLPDVDAALIERMTDAAMRELKGKASPQIAHIQVKRSKRPPRWVVWALPGAAAAAACLLLVTRPQEALPAYQTELVSGFESATRAPSSTPSQITFRAGRPFELALRPAVSTDLVPTVAVVLKHRTGTTPLPAHVEVGPMGTVHIRGHLPRALPGQPPWSLQVALAPPDAFNSAASTHAQTFQVEIVVPSP
jgi:hypothetical protein